MSLKEVVENSISASHSEGGIELRKRATSEIPILHRRLAVKAIDAFIFLVPRALQKLEQFEMHKQGFRYVASGAESTVIHKDGSVIKIVRGSENLKSNERVVLRDSKKRDFDNVQHYLGDYVINQTIDISEHPYRSGKEIVQTSQPYVEFTNLIHPSTYTGTVKVQDRSGYILDKLSDFVDRSWELFGSKALLPDINGIDNVVIDRSGNIVLIDTQPIGEQQPELQLILKSQLSSLASIVNE